MILIIILEPGFLYLFLVVVADDELEKVVPQNLEHHAHVGPVNAAIQRKK